MKLYFTPQTLKKIIKLLLLFILISIIIFYTKTLNVQAKTVDVVDKIGSTYEVRFSKAFLGNPISLPSLDYRLVPYHVGSPPYYPLVYSQSFISTAAYNMFATYSNIYVKSVLHFRFYYDILNENHFNPFPGIYSTNFHESSSGRFHGGGGVSFAPDTSGDKNIYDESKFWKFKFFEDLDIYDISYSYTYDEKQPYYDVYVYYSKILNSSNYSDLTDTFEFSFHTPTGDFSEVNQYKKIPILNAGYFEIKTLQLSDEPSNLFITNYYDEDSCLFTGNCDDPFADDEESSLFGGLIDDIITKVKDSFVSAWKSIKSLFTELFFPSEDFFKNAWEANFKLLENKFGFLFLPISILEEVLKHFLNLGNGSGIIHIPIIKDPIYSQTLISAQDLNLKQIFSTGAIGTVHDFYLVVVDILIVVGLISLCFKKFNLIFKGGQE